MTVRAMSKVRVLHQDDDPGRFDLYLGDTFLWSFRQQDDGRPTAEVDVTPLANALTLAVDRATADARSHLAINIKARAELVQGIVAAIGGSSSVCGHCDGPQLNAALRSMFVPMELFDAERAVRRSATIARGAHREVELINRNGLSVCSDCERDPVNLCIVSDCYRYRDPFGGKAGR